VPSEGVDATVVSCCESGEPPKGSRLWRCELELGKARDEVARLTEERARSAALMAEVERMRAEAKKVLYRDDGEPNDYEEAVAWWHEMVKHWERATLQ